MNSKFLFIVLLVIVTVILGFLRDYVFVSINHMIETGNDTNEHLFIFKWILTGFFSVLYMGITCAFLFLIFNSRKHVWIAIRVYVLIFVIAFLIGGIGYFTVSFERVYLLVRTILGIAQSPVIMIILIPACLINTSKFGNK